MSRISYSSEQNFILEHGFELTHSSMLMLTNNPAFWHLGLEFVILKEFLAIGQVLPVVFPYLPSPAPILKAGMRAPVGTGSVEAMMLMV